MQVVCIGIGGMLMSQILINVGMCLGIMPVIGITLPFFSSGGSSVATLYLGVGLALTIPVKADRATLHHMEG